jgi:hypothetical protein
MKFSSRKDRQSPRKRMSFSRKRETNLTTAKWTKGSGQNFYIFVMCHELTPITPITVYNPAEPKAQQGF